MNRNNVLSRLALATVASIAMVLQIMISVSGIVHLFLMIGMVSLSYGADDQSSLDKGLVGYWKLAGHFADSSGNANHGTNHGVQFQDTKRSGKVGKAATFNGIDAFIEVADNNRLDFGEGDFSIAAWVYTDENLRDFLGDIISKFDPATRKGLNFTLMNNMGVTVTHANSRNILFGVDDGHLDSEWTDCGRPGNTVLSSLIVYQGDLYAGSFEVGDGYDPCHVYRYAGGTEWIDCGSPDKCSAIMGMAVYKNKLYVGTCRYSGGGSWLVKTSRNPHPGGKVFRYDGGKKWTYCGKLSNPKTGDTQSGGGVGGLVVFNGKLFAGTNKHPGKGLYRYDGGETWTYCGHPNPIHPERAGTLAGYNGVLHIANWDHGENQVYRYDDDLGFEGIGCGKSQRVSQVFSLTAYQGKLFAGTWARGEVLCYQGNRDWESRGCLPGQSPVHYKKGKHDTNCVEVMGMLVYNGKLYAGTLPMAYVFRYDGNKIWTNTGQVDLTPDKDLNIKNKAPLRRAWALAVYKGKLYCTTLPSGKIKSLEAGKSVTYDHELAPGWRHLAAVRNGNKLQLYVDGTLVATSSEFNPADYNISNGVPLKIGFGQHDYFQGKMCEVRLYRRALSELEIDALYETK